MDHFVFREHSWGWGESEKNAAQEEETADNISPDALFRFQIFSLNF